MAITSLTYFIFVFFVLLAVTALQSKNEHKKTLLLIVSYYFYMTLDWRFACLLLILSLVNYIAGHLITTSANARVKKISLTTTIVISIGILFYFKYANFFVGSLYDLLHQLGMSGKSPVVDVILPIGISFMTFQAITYPLDLYAKRLNDPCSVKDFFLFMSFFPQLLSGPIIRASFFLPQLESNSSLSGKEMMSGFTLIIRGLIKKIMIADILAVQIVDPAFADPSGFSSAFLITALFSYSFQVYMDLGGYTDIAIGVGKVLGYKLPVNFNRPYLATSVSNFWQRWHITMSSFFRDYLYEAIRNWKWSNIYINLWIVFIAIGIWHGAGWNFVLYGFIHGSLVGFEHYQRQRRERKGLTPIVYRGAWLAIRVIQIFTIVTLTRVLFRGDDLSKSWDYLKAITTPSTTEFPLTPVAASLLLFSILLHYTPTRWRDVLMISATRVPVFWYASLSVILIYVVTAFNMDKVAFIYFQF